MKNQMHTNTISEIARILGVRVRKVNMRDPNVFHREHDTVRNPESLAFREGIRFEYESMMAEIRGNGSYLVFELKADLNAGAWSINEPDQITLTSRTSCTSIDLPVFASGAALCPRATKIIHQPAFQSLLEELGLGERESLHFYKNAVVYYARSADTAKFLERANALSRFVAAITTPQEMHHVDLPGPFADLNDCAQEWAISDDTERAEALETASAEVLRNLVERVAPRLPSINEYLNTHSGEEDTDLESLAETVSEAQIAIQQAT